VFNDGFHFGAYSDVFQPDYSLEQWFGSGGSLADNTARLLPATHYDNVWVLDVLDYSNQPSTSTAVPVDNWEMSHLFTAPPYTSPARYTETIPHNSVDPHALIALQLPLMPDVGVVIRQLEELGLLVDDLVGWVLERLTAEGRII
jgi:hypothetical protein